MIDLASSHASLLARGSDNAGHATGATAGILIGVIVVGGIVSVLVAIARRR